MTISEREWRTFIRRLSAVANRAADDLKRWVESQGGLVFVERNDLIDYAYGLATKYGEAAAAVAAEMYDEVAALSRAAVPAALPAETATISEVGKAINGTLKTQNTDIISGSVYRLVKMAGVDTTMQNAIRDGAEWAWIPQGETCAFCITLASRGWQRASKKVLKGGHAEHIHANCDCTFAIRFGSTSNVEGYDPDKYLRMYEDAPLDHWNTPDGKPPRGHAGAERNTSKNRINAMRREMYADQLKRKNNDVGFESVNGKRIRFDGAIAEKDKFKSARTLIQDLSKQYNTRLEVVMTGAEKAAGDVDISGSRMRLNTSQETSVLHEFAHTLASSNADKYGLTNDEDFWKEIKKVYRAYHKDVDSDQDARRWISSYEHSSRNVDEFFAEAFAHAKAKELGIEIPAKYGSDFTYSDKVLAIVKKYFGR